MVIGRGFYHSMYTPSSLPVDVDISQYWPYLFSGARSYRSLVPTMIAIALLSLAIGNKSFQKLPYCEGDGDAGVEDDDDYPSHHW